MCSETFYTNTCAKIYLSKIYINKEPIERILNARLLTRAYYEIHRAEEPGRGKKWEETTGESYVFSFDF